MTFTQFFNTWCTRFAVITLLFLSVGCNKSRNERQLLVVNLKNSVFIINEGSFLSGNAALSVYDTVERRIINEVFYNVNGTPTGDVMQSMRIIDRRGYLVMNNSGKVIVMDTTTCKYIGTITGLVSPRYIEPISPNKIYISNLFSPRIDIANPKTLQVTGHVEVGAASEQMVCLNDDVYVCSWSYNNKIYKIDTRTDRVVDSMVVPKQPCSMVLDSKNRLWVLSDGGYTGMPGGEELAALTLIEPTSMTILRQLDFASLASSPSRLTINAKGDMLYFLDNRYGSTSSVAGGAYRMSINDEKLPAEPFIVQQKRLFYGLGVDPHNGEIYLTDAIDYSQYGMMMRYSSDGVLIDSQPTRINPSGFCF